jgi:adenylate kinase
MNVKEQISTEKRDRVAWLKGGSALCPNPPGKPAGQVWRLVLLGAPGVGKGTQAELLSSRLGACHLSTGDVFRAAKSLCSSDISPAMKNALEYMRRGDLVPDEIVLAMIAERTRCMNCSGGFLLDGFPRTVAQAEELDKLLQREKVSLSAVLDYELPLDQVVARLSGRRTCPKCKAVFHVTTRPPRVKDTCDNCSAELYQREDDRPESIRVRMAAYEKSTRPLIDFYQKRGLLVTVPAEGSPEDIYQRSRLALTK